MPDARGGNSSFTVCKHRSRMTATDTALGVDWLAVCRRAVEGLRAVLAESPTTAERVRETGTRGSGGDRTLLLDAAAEDVVFAELAELAEQGYRFRAVSEERGEVDFGSDHVRVIIDPIDGSLNAKRSTPHYALSVAVADGPTMADVAFGFVHDFGANEQFWAWRGQGAWLDSASEPRRRTAPRPDDRRATQPRRQARAGRDRGLRPALDRRGDRRTRRDRTPAQSARSDRDHPVRGRGGAVGRDGDADPLPRRRRRRRAADRP